MIDYERVVYDFADRILHVHAKDMEVDRNGLYEHGVLSAGMNWQVPRLPGLGEVRWDRFCSALYAVGYDRWISIEHEDRAFEGDVEPDAVWRVTEGIGAVAEEEVQAAMRREEREIRARAEEKLSFFGERLMGYRWDQPAYSLSYANRRRLEIARAMATEPRILLLDEPAAGMNPTETHEITELIGKLRDDGGYTILLIEHDMHVVEGISDRVVALDHGVKIAEGTFDAVATDPRVVEAYLGTKAVTTN